MRLSYGEDVSYLVEHPILQKHIDVIERLIDSRSFAVFYGEYDSNKNDKAFFVEECCDNYYKHILTINDCRELAKLFSEIANELEVNNE